MALIIETGTGVLNANSYVTVSELRDFATARGVTLPATESAVEAMLVKAADFLGTYEGQFCGQRTNPAQGLSWPRTGATQYGQEIPSDAIPPVVKAAQMQSACYLTETTSLMPINTGQEVVKQKVDVLEVQYAPTGQGSAMPSFPLVDAMLAPLFCPKGGWKPFTICRA